MRWTTVTTGWLAASILMSGGMTRAVAEGSARPPQAVVAAGDGNVFETMKQGDAVDGYRVTAVYLNDAGRPMGARFVHRKSGFVLDLLRIESVPQAFTWVRSFPDSDQGEPHTQEHLLLGKGARGRAFAGLETMWLATSSAFTDQLRTCYHFNTSAGVEVFYDMFAAQMEALLHPNYSDEEIRREVRNFGIDQNADGSLRLEEKGSVYNEMVSSTRNSYWKAFRAAGQQVYGPSHPLSFNSGGEPSGIRTMKPEDIRRFHRANYHLWNMGTIAALPASVPIREALARLSAILDKAEAPEGGKPAARPSEERLPPPRPAAAGTIAIVEYPDSNDQQPSPIVFSWPADRTLDLNESLLLDLFVSAIAGDPTTNLYLLFVNSTTRRMDIGAKAVFGMVGREQGHAVQITLADVDASQLTNERIVAIRALVVDEIARIASLPDGSAELKAFNDRIGSRLIQAERDAAKFINSPPRFGARGTGSEWMEHLRLLERTGEFRKSLTFAPQIAFVRGLLAKDVNFWRDTLAKWKIAGVVPCAAAARPSPSLLAAEDRERTARALAETERLRKRYAGAQAQEALRRYRADYDAESNRIEEIAKKIPPASFVKTPPMTLDDPLQYEARTLDGGIALVVSRFENMSSATVGLALRLDGVPAPLLRFVSLLPALVSQVGVIESGRSVPYEEMSERLRRELLSLDASFSSNPRTDRVELVVQGSGLGSAEAARALDWMTLILQHPDWRPENLPRIRDVVDQSLSALRNLMQGPEEGWVQDPAIAYRKQNNPIFLAAESAQTAEYNALRLRWLLKDPPPQGAGPLTEFLTRLAEAPKHAPREDLKSFLRAGMASPGETSAAPQALQPLAAAFQSLAPSDRAIAKEALEDLDATLLEIPDGSMAADWAFLCTGMRDDLLVSPVRALADLDTVRRALLKRSGARMFFAGSSALETSLSGKFVSLTATLDSQPVARTAFPAVRLIDARLRGRDPAAEHPVYVGLLAPNKQGGVIMTSVPGAHFADSADREKQLDYLASRLFSGYGPHGIFLKTIGAGLAYSNGLRASVASGRMGYYAERTPELPQTVRFVIDDLRNEPRNPALASYAVAQVFGESRAAGSYESRAEAIAADLADGQSPGQVRVFRESILALSHDPTLGAKLFDRKDKVYGQVLPGYNVRGKDVPGAVYFVIGPDRQLDAWEKYLQSVENGETKLFRLYPRDFWQP